MSYRFETAWLRLLPLPLRERLQGRTRLLSMINNSGWLLFEKLVRLLLGLFVSAWVARHLGPMEFGELAYVLAYISFFQAVAVLGMDGIIVRDLVHDSDRAGQILGTSFALRVMAGTLCWCLAVGGMALLNGWADRSVWLVALAGGSLVFQAVDTVDLWFQSKSQSRRTVIVKLFSYFFSSCIKIVLILNQAPLFAFAVVMTLDAVTVAIGLAIAYRRLPSSNRWQIVFLQGKKLLQESWPFMLSGISIMIYMRIDQIMIRELLGEKELGVYAAVLPFATAWQFIPMTLFVSLAPFLARKKAENEKSYMLALAQIFRLFSGLGWLVSIPIFLLSPYLVEIFLGKEYLAGSAILAIYVFTNIFIGLGVAQGLWLINEGKSKLSLLKTFIGAIVAVSGNLILIPKMGLMGVAVSAVLAQFASAVLSNIFFAPKIFILQLRGLFLLGSRVERSDN